MKDQVLTPWLYRRWTFDFPAELYPAVLERLRGTPARAEEIAGGLGADALIACPDDGWSVQRHIGHMGDLERLMQDRLDAYERGGAALPAADMSNARTVATDHDARAIGDVLSDFRTGRAATMARLDACPRDFFGRSAWHERLGVQKRVVDTCVFFADHDDHHLALIRTAINQTR